MDVTCERCGTEYDFDDALVSERGTTVKCTNCGAQFRVYRPAPAAGPERWVVRTVDGRELVFSALRELQAAISTGVAGRDDVLSRGGGRPRRLGSIAELEPFFKQAISVAATSTAPGLGLPAARAAYRQEGSVAIPLPRGADEPPRRTGTLPPPPPILNGMPAAPDRSEVRARGVGDPVVSTALTGSMAPTSVAAGVARLQNLVAADLAEPITVPRGDPRGPTVQVEARGVTEQSLAVPIGPPPTAVPAAVVTSQAGRVVVGDATVRDGTQGFADTVAAISGTRTEMDGALARDAARAEPPPATRKEDSGVIEKRAAPSAQATPAPVPEAPRSRPRTPLLDAAMARQKAARETGSPGSRAQVTPTPPSEVRVSYSEPEPSVSPRFSMAATSKRNSSVRWIVGVVLVGATALLGATVGRKYLSAPAPTPTAAPAADDRVTKLLAEGEKSLREGDLEGAKEKLDKASVLAETDPQVAAHLAHLAVVRADLRWIKVRVMPAEGPETTLAKAELADAVAKMKKAVEAARALAPNDAAVKRHRLEALRISGDRAGARALVTELGGSKTPDDALALAALDLAEDKPVWPTVIERLREAAAADGNLGRARAMLVYALATSGDVAAAKAEHDRLAALPRPHPLTAPLLAYMARVEMEQPAPTAQPVAGGAKAAPSAAAGAGASTAPPATTGAPPSSGDGKLPDGRVPDDYVYKPPGAQSADVSDLPGHTPAPAPTPTEAPAPTPTQAPAPAPTPSSTTPPGVDTSDLPGFGK